MNNNQPAVTALNDMLNKYYEKGISQGRDRGYSQGYEAGKEEALALNAKCKRDLELAIFTLKSSYANEDCQYAFRGLVEIMGNDKFEAWAKQRGVL